jgi:hypothetical protein
MSMLGAALADVPAPSTRLLAKRAAAGAGTGSRPTSAGCSVWQSYEAWKTVWVKSSYSGGTGGDCVEIVALPDGGRGVRDSKDPDGPVLVLTTVQWADLRTSL